MRWMQITTNVFGLSSAVLDCSDKTTVDHFGNDLLVDDNGDDSSYFSHVPPHSRLVSLLPQTLLLLPPPPALSERPFVPRTILLTL